MGVVILKRLSKLQRHTPGALDIHDEFGRCTCVCIARYRRVVHAHHIGHRWAHKAGRMQFFDEGVTGDDHDHMLNTLMGAKRAHGAEKPLNQVFDSRLLQVVGLLSIADFDLHLWGRLHAHATCW